MSYHRAPEDLPGGADPPVDEPAIPSFTAPTPAPGMPAPSVAGSPTPPAPPAPGPELTPTPAPVASPIAAVYAGAPTEEAKRQRKRHILVACAIIDAVILVIVFAIFLR